MRILNFKAQSKNAFFAIVKQMFGGSYCRARSNQIVKKNNKLLYLERKPRLGPSWFSRGSSVLVELEFGELVFVEGGKPENPGEKPSEQGREPTTNSTFIFRAGIEPGTHWWEANAHTTAPSLFPVERSLGTKTVLGCSRNLRGADKTSIDGSEKRICWLSFEF